MAVLWSSPLWDIIGSSTAKIWKQTSAGLHMTTAPIDAQQGVVFITQPHPFELKC
jgi:hypothetical protein